MSQLVPIASQIGSSADLASTPGVGTPLSDTISSAQIGRGLAAFSCQQEDVEWEGICLDKFPVWGSQQVDQAPPAIRPSLRQFLDEQRFAADDTSRLLRYVNFFFKDSTGCVWSYVLVMKQLPTGISAVRRLHTSTFTLAPDVILRRRSKSPWLYSSTWDEPTFVPRGVTADDAVAVSALSQHCLGAGSSGGERLLL